MKRLTYKLDEPVTSKYLHYEYMKIADYDINKGNCGRITNDIIYNKLGKLEDLEEELGIDILTLFRALKEGIFIQSMWDNHEIIKEVNVDLEYSSGEYKICPDMQIKRKVKDYGKTWALTREELEDKDE